MTKRFLTGSALAALLAAAACTVRQSDTYSPSGPSTYARSVTMTASPDRITQDGASTSRLIPLVIGPDGRPLGGIQLRLDMLIGGQANDYGTLSARTVVTSSDGTPTTLVTYKAPPAPPPPGDTTVSTVSIRATIIGTDAQSNSSVITDIRLVPAGVIRPPAGTPTAAFTYTPKPVSVNVPVNFDASTSVPGTNATSITSYSWNWGDGSSNSTGRTATHAFTSGGSFNVTLTVTSDRGLAASASQTIPVDTTDPFTGDWVSSPPMATGAVVGQEVRFNADAVKTSAGHQVTSFNWNFGDGDDASGSLQEHAYSAAGTYSVVLSVTDDLGRSKVFAAKTIVIGSGNPIPSFTLSPGAPTGGVDVLFDASGTQVFGGTTIESYQWTFPSGNPSSSVFGPQTTTNFAVSGTSYSVSVVLTVVDSLGRRGSTAVSVTVSP